MAGCSPTVITASDKAQELQIMVGLLTSCFAGSLQTKERQKRPRLDTKWGSLASTSFRLLLCLDHLDPFQTGDPRARSVDMGRCRSCLRARLPAFRSSLLVLSHLSFSETGALLVLVLLLPLLLVGCCALDVLHHPMQETHSKC